MPIRLLLILHLVLVALVAVNVVYAFTWPAQVETAILVVIAAVLLAMAFWVARAAAQQRAAAALARLQILGTLGLAAAAGALAAPAWQALGADGGGAAAGRMAPMFLIALALYGANLWLDAARAAEERSELARLARLLSGPRLLPALIAALLLTAGTLLGMDWTARSIDAAQVVTHRFLERGIIPPITVLLFFWGILLLLGKQWNAWYLRRALARWRDGMHPAGAAAPLVTSLDALTGAASALEESIALLWQRHAESYVFPRYIGWAVPVLGFIGTVLGISLAADGIRRIIGSDSGLSGLSSDLSGAIAPLGIAFDTTLIALSLSVALMLLLSLAQRAEERMLATLEWEVRGASRGR